MGVICDLTYSKEHTQIQKSAISLNDNIQHYNNLKKEETKRNCQIQVIINGQLENFTPDDRLKFKNILAATLDVDSELVSILEVKEGSIKLTIELPIESAEKLISLFEKKDATLDQLQSEYKIDEVKRIIKNEISEVAYEDHTPNKFGYVFDESESNIKAQKKDKLSSDQKSKDSKAKIHPDQIYIDEHHKNIGDFSKAKTPLMQTIPIAIAEDSMLFSKALQALLQKQGNTEVLFTAENGAILLDQLEKFQPKVILMDIRMPDVDGIEATAKVKELYPNIFVTMLTNHYDIPTIKSALHAGANGYLVKDIDAEELQTAIIKVAEGKTYFCEKVQSLINTID